MEDIKTAVYEIGGTLNTKVLVPEDQGVFIIEQDQMDDNGEVTGVVGQFGFPIEGIPSLTQLLAGIYIASVIGSESPTIN